MAINPWNKLTNDGKLDRLRKVLTRAGPGGQFRKRWLASAESAKQAVKEVAEIEFPEDFRIQFVTPEERLQSLVLAIPDYIPPESGASEVRNAEDFQVCTYL